MYWFDALGEPGLIPVIDVSKFPLIEIIEIHIFFTDLWNINYKLIDLYFLKPFDVRPEKGIFWIFQLIIFIGEICTDIHYILLDLCFIGYPGIPGIPGPIGTIYLFY